MERSSHIDVPLTLIQLRLTSKLASQTISPVNSHWAQSSPNSSTAFAS